MDAPAHDERRPRRVQPDAAGSPGLSSCPTSPSRSRPRRTAARRTSSGCDRASATRPADRQGRPTSAPRSSATSKIGGVPVLRRHRRRGSLQARPKALRSLARDRRGRRRADRHLPSRRSPTRTSCTSSRCPSPTSCPRARRRRRGTHPLPATGPYVIAATARSACSSSSATRPSASGRRRRSRTAIRTEILFEMVETPDQAVNDVIHGRADAFGSIGGLPSRRLLDRRRDPLRGPGALEPLSADLRPLPRTPAFRPSTVSMRAGR